MRGNSTSLDTPIAESELKKCTADSKNNKSAGVDYIINENVKNTRDMCVLYMFFCLTKSINTSNLHEEWLVGCIVPIYLKREG